MNKQRACNRLECQIVGWHVRACARDTMKEELREANPTFTDAQLEEALDDLDAMERIIHPEVK